MSWLFGLNNPRYLSEPMVVRHVVILIHGQACHSIGFNITQKLRHSFWMLGDWGQRQSLSGSPFAQARLRPV